MNDGSLSIGKEEILQQLEKVTSSELFRSEKNQQLLTYLVNKTLENEPPKETTIALEFFDEDITEKDTSYVRVAVYHLRNKLKEYYLTEGKKDKIRLSLEKGSYEVTFTKNLDSEVTNGKSTRRLMVALWATIFLLTTLLLYQYFAEGSEGKFNQSFILHNLNGNNKPVLVVLGDMFMYHNEEGNLVRDYSINTLEDLQKEKPDLATLNQSRSKYLTRLHAISLYNISGILNSLPKDVNFRMGSELSIEDIMENNIVFIGFFKSMYLLDTYFKISAYRPGLNYANLMSKAKGDTIQITGDPGELHKDYGIFSRVAGPGNSYIFIIAGFTDTSVEMISSTIHQEGFFEKTIANKFDDHITPENFEILFEVSGYDRKEVSNMEVVEAHELQNISGMWN